MDLLSTRSWWDRGNVTCVSRARLQLAAASNDAEVPWIHVVTPTCARLTQKADLTRLAQTLRLVARLHWTVVEDANSTSDYISRLLQRTAVPHTHLAIHTPAGVSGALAICLFDVRL